MELIGKDITRAKALLASGQLVGIPTETVYGLAANALDPLAVAGIFEAKNRPHFDPLIIHTNSFEKVQHYVTGIPPLLEKLAKAFWPGPLTLLLPKQPMIPDLVTSGLETVAVRIPNHPLTLELLSQLDFPLAAPSANPFGYISPTTASHVARQLGDKVAYILDGGPSHVGLESTIVGMEENTLCVYRLGGLAISELEAVAGSVVLKINQSSNPKAPGQLKSHYAPRKPLFIGNLEQLDAEYMHQKVGVIAFGSFTSRNPQADVVNLSEKGDYQEAASKLFSVLRQLDESPCECILTQLLPEEHLGIAINDRLSRAAAEKH